MSNQQTESSAVRKVPILEGGASKDWKYPPATWAKGLWVFESFLFHFYSKIGTWKNFSSDLKEKSKPEEEEWAPSQNSEGLCGKTLNRGS